MEQIEEGFKDDRGLVEIRKQAVDEGLSFGVTRLRDQYRMKPKPGAVPVRWVKSPYSRSKNPVYLVADCVPLKEHKSKEPTESQKLGAVISGLKATLRSKRNVHSRELNDWLAKHWADLVVLDTETTGLESLDQVIELAIISMNGDILFNQRFRPSVDIDPHAQEVHGISSADLASCPSWPEFQPQIERILAAKTALIFNQSFDMRLLRQTAEAYNCPTLWIDNLHTCCAMYEAAEAYGATNRYGGISLSAAVASAGLLWNGHAHSAVTDSEMTRRLMIAMADQFKPVQAALDNAIKRKSELKVNQ